MHSQVRLVTLGSHLLQIEQMLVGEYLQRIEYYQARLEMQENDYWQMVLIYLGKNLLLLELLCMVIQVIEML